MKYLNTFISALGTCLFIFLCLHIIFETPAVKSENIKKESEEIKIGALFSLSGYGTVGGTSELRGLLLAYEEIKAQGGIGDRPLTLITEDFNSDSKMLASSVVKLSTVDNVSFIIGPNWAEFADIAAPIAKRLKLTMITTSGYTSTLFDNNPYIFSMQYPPEKVIQPFTEYILSRNFTSVTLISSSNTFFELLSDTLITSLDSKVPLTRETIINDSLDYKSLLLKIKQSGENSGIVVFMTQNGPASTFVKQAKSFGIKGDRLLLGPVVLYDEILKTNQDINEDIIFFDYISDLSENFRTKYKNRFKEEPKLGSAFSYDALYLLKEALEECNSNGITDINQCIMKGLETGASGEVRFNENRERILLKPASSVFQMREGKAVRIN